MAEFKTFEDLKAWQACRDLRRFVSRSIIPLLPRSEQFRLTDQLYRCSRSTTANIAEGYGRYHYLDKVKFCSQARGSVYEVLDHALEPDECYWVANEARVRGRDEIDLDRDPPPDLVIEVEITATDA